MSKEVGRRLAGQPSTLNVNVQAGAALDPKAVAVALARHEQRTGRSTRG